MKQFALVFLITSMLLAGFEPLGCGSPKFRPLIFRKSDYTSKVVTFYASKVTWHTWVVRAASVTLKLCICRTDPRYGTDLLQQRFLTFEATMPIIGR